MQHLIEMPSSAARSSVLTHPPGSPQTACCWQLVSRVHKDAGVSVCVQSTVPARHSSCSNSGGQRGDVHLPGRGTWALGICFCARRCLTPPDNCSH